jgi:tetratricopeptide (TPR) repeat protein/4-amino-4-deoxy-L-arabinose transferase-like glycosyltransferase
VNRIEIDETPQTRSALAGGGWKFAIGLFLLAVAIRLLFLREMAASPLWKTPLVDAETYDGLARNLAATRQWGRDFFWQPPLYPFLLSLVYSATGSSMTAARVLQALLGGGTCLLTYSLGARILGRRGGIAAGIIVALYMPLVFFEFDLIAAGLAAFLAVVLALVLLEAEARARRWSPFLFGLVGSWAVLTRPTFLPFLVAAGVWLIARTMRREGVRKTAIVGALVVSGFALGAVPAAVVNGRSGSGSSSILPSSGGINFYIGNNPRMCETLTARPGWQWTKLTTLPYREGVESRREQQAFFYGKVLEYARTSPGRFLGNLGSKTLRFLSAREMPRNIDLYTCRRYSRLLGLLAWKVGGFGFPFGILLPLAVLGAWRCRRRIPMPIWLFSVCFSAAVIVVFVADRYRVEMIPILAVLAAGGLGAIRDVIRSRERRPMIVAGGIVAVTLAVSCLPGPFCEEKLHYSAELDFMLGLADFNRAQAATDGTASAGRLRDAQNEFGKALAEDPEFADAHSEMGNVKFAQGDYRAAAESYVRALELDPEHGKALHSLGVLLYLAGSNAEAIRSLQHAHALDPSFARTDLFLGHALTNAGNLTEALQVLERGIRRESDPVYRALGMSAAADVVARAGDHRAAIERYRRALETDPRCVQAMTGLAWLLATDTDTGIRDGAQALKLAQSAQSQGDPSPATLDALAAALAETGRYADAAAAARTAIETARSGGNEALAAEITARLRLYEGGRAYRSAGP